MTDLIVATCSYQAADFAVKNWHYSKKMPAGKCYRIGVWENKKFVGAVIFSWGANNNLSSPYGLEMIECVELVRVACRQHDLPVTKFVSLAIKKLKADNPGIRLIISFADSYQGHIGTIYKAGNWFYLGKTTNKVDYIMPDGSVLNRRAYTGKGFNGERRPLPKDAVKFNSPPKLRYAMPLDKAMRRKIAKLALPYEYAVEGLEVSRLDSVKEVQVQSLPTALRSI